MVHTWTQAVKAGGSGVQTALVITKARLGQVRPRLRTQRIHPLFSDSTTSLLSLFGFKGKIKALQCSNSHFTFGRRKLSVQKLSLKHMHTVGHSGKHLQSQYSGDRRASSKTATQQDPEKKHIHAT